MNRVVIHGHLTRDPDLRDAGQSRVCKFTVAENQRFNRDQSNFHDCEAWGKTGEFVEKYFGRGAEIVVSGELRQREYEAKDGSKRRAWSVNVDQVDFCGKASDNQRGGQQGGQSFEPVSGAATADSIGLVEITDEELPF